MLKFLRTPRVRLKYAEHLTKPLTQEEAGAIARRLTDEHILDVPTVDDVWRLMDTITLLYMEREFPQYVKAMSE
jgi:hypothetical protein